MQFQHLCNTYLRELLETHDNTNATAELSLHASLKAFLEQSADCLGHAIALTHEPRQLDIGRPDFIATDGLLPIGYIEAEKFGTDLNALTGHAREQNTRFIENLDNFVLTNFVEFRLYTEGELRATASLSSVGGTSLSRNVSPVGGTSLSRNSPVGGTSLSRQEEEIETRRSLLPEDVETGRSLLPEGIGTGMSLLPEEVHALETLLNRFFDAGTLNITTPEVLATHLARRTRELQTQIATAIADEESTIFRMFKAFQEQLLSTLTPADFADMYAQTLAYGMFAARYTLPNATNFSRSTAAATLPRSNPFLRRLFYQVASPELDDSIGWVLDEIATLLRSVSTYMLRTAFDARTHAEDPVIHFYETFLAAYDPRRRVDRGVYYTPQPVISYIVRSVDALLKTALRKPDGLADNETLILDPATGTGGFLMEVLHHIRQHVIETDGAAAWSPYVNTSLAERLFGFELLVAPYTIAHLNLSRFLQAHGWTASDTERIHIYLTNTLEEPVEREGHIFAEFLTDEANAAVSVKRDLPILVIVGNPPYPRSSANPSRDARGRLNFIGGLIEDYKSIDGQSLGERNYQGLQGDYVKFIRWGQWRIDKNGEGALGYIVNNGFLDGVIFRGMRHSLMKSFNAIYHLNLHGNRRVGEDIPDGESDENVFDIQQGVSILLCVKERDNPDPAKVYYADVWGERAEKYRRLSEIDVQSTEWQELQPTAPFYLFVPQQTEDSTEYENGWHVTDIFQESSLGIVTARDKLTIHLTPEAVRQTVTDFVSLPAEAAREKYNLGRDRRDWQVRLAQEDLRNHPEAEQHIVPIRYRPFDTRFTYYTARDRGFHCRPRQAISAHLRSGRNFALCVCRGSKGPKWQHTLVTDNITDQGYVSNKSGPAHVFPLYLYPDIEQLGLPPGRSINLTPAFLKAFSETLALPQIKPFGLPEGISPEDILAYIYAVLHGPTYRQRYAEFLKYDFPRVPLPTDLAQFQKLAGFGHTLIDAHLGRLDMPGATSRFEGEGDSVVGRVQYRDGHVWINRTQYFSDVPVAVWEFEIGAYQPCEKWLRDRRGEALTHADIRQYRQVLSAVAETLKVTGEIDN